MQIVLTLVLLSSLALANIRAATWWKGNLHTHTLWSDGDDFPDMVTAWFKDQGYHFLALSDHNVFQVGDKWIEINPTNKTRTVALTKYVQRFGDAAQRKVVEGKTFARLKTLAELKSAFEVPGKFLVIPSEEITDRYKIFPVHINATNPRELLKPQGGNSVYEVMQNNINALWEQRRRTGQRMIPHLNHPNFGWGVTAEDLLRVRGERFFEVYNGHPTVHNAGDDRHASTDTMWDVILTVRLAELNMEPIYGLGVDDSHHYHELKPSLSNSGRGWIWVDAPSLSADDLIQAMEKGDFYASSGVRLDEVKREPKKLTVLIHPEEGVQFTTQFIGTRRGYDPKREPVRDAAGNVLPMTYRYSKDVGAVLAEVKGLRAEYALKGDEIYVRAKVVSSKVKANAAIPGELETAWTQPLIPGQL